MARIRAFRAVRPEKRYIEDIASLPYDVFSRKEAREYVKTRPLSFLNIDRPETQFPSDFNMYSDKVYAKANRMILDEIDKGYFVKDEKDSLYIYELTMNERVQTGLVGLSSIDDYLSGVCKKHENTVEEKEEDRIKHIDRTSMQTGPIFLCYRKNKVISDIINRYKKNEPLYVFKDLGVLQRVWIIDDENDIEKICENFNEVKNTYIADGHHRTASAVKVGLKRRQKHQGFKGDEEFNFFLSVLFPDDELEILDYNRVIKDLNSYSKNDFLKEISKSFEIRELENYEKPLKKFDFSMYLAGKAYMLSLKEDLKSMIEDDPIKSLDASVLQDLVLDPILGIKDPRKDKRIDFVGGIRGIEELKSMVDDLDSTNISENAVSFMLFPTSIDELLRVADEGLLMPPKSTWFEPKLRSGVFLHEIER